MTHWPDDLDDREAEWDDLPAIDRAEGAAILDRLAATGSIVEPRPIRRHYGRDLLGLLGIIIIALGAVALGLLWEKL